jgi:hypothetical protein
MDARPFPIHDINIDINIILIITWGYTVLVYIYFVYKHLSKQAYIVGSDGVRKLN